MPAKVILEVISGPIQGTRFAFDGHDTFIFGRKADCHAQLKNDGFVSRHHFVLEVNPPDARLRDLGSLGGTIVNGAKHGGRDPGETPEAAAARSYPQVDLNHDDEIVVGNTTIKVQVETPPCCANCGNELDDPDETRLDFHSPRRLCAACRNAPRPARHATVMEIACERCGKDVSAEVGLRRASQYICQDCQSRAMSEDGGMRRLLQDAAREAGSGPAPVIDGYTLGEELGKGGMGAVYRATHNATGQEVAVKVMLAKIAVDATRRKQFLREIDVLRGLQHPHVVRLLASGAAGSAFYLIMEMCDAGSLAQWMARYGGPLPERVAAPLLLQCLDGLAHAHCQNFVHRDLKPQNILVQKVAGRPIAKLCDFGLAKNFEAAGLSGMTTTGQIGGTFPFMPREQLTDYKFARPVSDVWSIAATFYKVLTGHCPLEFPAGRDHVAVILSDDPKPLRERNPAISAPLAAALDRALVMDPARRLQTADALKVAVQAALG